jgi:hypothetical protein
MVVSEACQYHGITMAPYWGFWNATIAPLVDFAMTVGLETLDWQLVLKQWNSGLMSSFNSNMPLLLNIHTQID